MDTLITTPYISEEQDHGEVDNLDLKDIVKSYVNIQKKHRLTEEENDALIHGKLAKRVIFLRKLFGGNTLYFYDENLQLILDKELLFKASLLVITNQLRVPNYALDGVIMMDKEITIESNDSQLQKVVFIKTTDSQDKHSHAAYEVSDEASMHFFTDEEYDVLSIE